MNPTYCTFLRSATNWEQFAKARKRVQDRGLTYEEAQRACIRYNAARTAGEIQRGTKLEFTAESAL